MGFTEWSYRDRAGRSQRAGGQRAGLVCHWKHQRGRAPWRGLISHSRAHALQRNADKIDKRDRAKNPGRRRLHQRLHIVRSHRFLDRRAEGWCRDRAGCFGRCDDEFDSAAGRIFERAGSHPARVRDGIRRSGPDGRTTSFRHRLSETSLPASGDWSVGGLQSAHARTGDAVLQNAIRAE